MYRNNEEVERFYQEVSDLLGIKSTYEYNPHTLGGVYRTRWNNRKPGNGRFEGFGLIRFFGPENIHVAINHPVTLTGMFGSTVEVLDALKKALDENQDNG